MSQERITFAAVRREDNVIIYGRDHSECLGRTPCRYASKAKQGFVTDRWRFVGRDEALTIALTAGQITYPSAGTGLISEMLWCERDGGRYDYDSTEGYVERGISSECSDKME